MDFITILKTLLPILIEVLPVILNKPDKGRRTLLRWVVVANKFATEAGDRNQLGAQAAFVEVAHMLGGLAEAAEPERQRIMSTLEGIKGRLEASEAS